MTNPIKLGIAGLGTVGIGVVKIIQQKAKLCRPEQAEKSNLSLSPQKQGKKSVG